MPRNRPLIIDITTLPPEGEQFELTLNDAELRLQWWGAEHDLAGWRFEEATAYVTLRPFLGGVDFHARIRIRCTAPCVRCLDDLPLEIEDDIRLRFEPAVPEKELRLSDTALDILEYDGTSVDLTEWLASQVALSVPDLPRCETEAARDCAGPALQTSSAPELDPRWAALAQLKSDRGD